MLTLRRASLADRQLVWQWANDQVTRAASFDSAEISWESHVTWFDAQLMDPAVLFLIGEDSGTPVSQLRFDIDGNEATLSIAVAPTARRRGYGLATLEGGVEQLFATTDVELVHAYVKSENAASRELFIGVRFEEVDPAMIRGQQSAHFIRRRTP
jgi:UDP-2,4-diacetamido-2,4,6-trideoxy-beta-L-altropyranose hydrolase